MLRPEDVSRAVPGRPFRIYALDAAALSAHSPSRPLSALLRESGEWFVPALVDGDWRLLITVCKRNGAWEVVGISDAVLAAEIGRFQARWPGLAAAAGASADAAPKFVRVFEAAADLMQIGPPGREFVWAFRSGLRALGLPEGSLLPAETVVPLLRTAVARKD
jgi:hypothetical protein